MDYGIGRDASANLERSIQPIVVRLFSGSQWTLSLGRQFGDRLSVSLPIVVAVWGRICLATSHR